MSDQSIRFENGAGYERYMGHWSQSVGAAFIDWLAPAPGLRWLDVGCGNGAFTEMAVNRCAPVSVDGIDPSDAQLAFARTRPAARIAKFQQGDAMALPFPDNSFDVAVMPLVIFFVPDPATGVAEMARVVRSAGIVAAYAWDPAPGGFPYEALVEELRALGAVVPSPPSPDAARLDNMQALWEGAGLGAIETREIVVERTFRDFDDFWTTIQLSASAGRAISTLSPDHREMLRSRMAVRLPADPGGRITYGARANAVAGRVR